MKKISLLSGVVLGSLVLVGCSSIMPNSKTTESSSSGAQGTQEGALSSWISAVKTGAGLKCTMTNTTTQQTSTLFAKGQKMRMSGSISEDTSNPYTDMLMADNMLYVWDNQKKEGVTFTIPSQSEMEQENPNSPASQFNTPDFTSEESIQSFEDKGFEMDCAPSAVSEAEFSVPTDITFQDFSQMMQKALEQLQGSMTEDQKSQMNEAFEE